MTLSIFKLNPSKLLNKFVVCFCVRPEDDDDADEAADDAGEEAEEVDAEEDDDQDEEDA